MSRGLANELDREKSPRPARRLFRPVVPVVLGTVAILITIRATSLLGLPDIGDPFDIKEFVKPIPDESNAFVLYRQAFAKMGKQPAQATGDWSIADSVERQWLGENREALELWRKGTTRPDALYITPSKMNIATLLPVIQAMRDFARLASLEGTRLESEGDMAGALDWYIAMLRSSRHCGRKGVEIERLVGIAIGGVASNRIFRWAVDPRVDAVMLRKALQAAIDAEGKTPLASNTFKCDYIMFENTIADPAFQDPAKLIEDAPWLGVPWVWKTGPGQVYFKAERSIKREPERSRRVYRLVIANWLAYCDRSKSGRPPMANLPSLSSKPSSFGLYTPDDSAPGSLKALKPDELARWFHSTMYAETLTINFSKIDKAMTRDRLTFATLLVALANELCKREKGQYADKAEDLIGVYLKTLPEGYAVVK